VFIHRVLSRRLSSVFLLLILPALGSRLAAQTAPGPRIVSSRQLSATERVMTLQGVPARTAHGPLHAQPPAPPPGLKEEEDEETQPLTPVIEDRISIPPSRTAETAGEPLQRAQAPGSFVLLRDSALTPPSGYSSSINEPNVGSQGDGLFTTHNWYAEISSNNGASYSYISPYDTFPNTPPDFTGGFCCDQRVTQVSSRNLIVWYLQYSFNGAVPLSSGVRVAVAHGQADLAANSWHYYDFTPGQFGLVDAWFDFPHLQASANDLYFTTNVFGGSGAFVGALVVRMPLAQLDAGLPLTVDSYLTTSFGSIMAVTGAAAEGSRPGRTTMYFAALYSSTSLKVLTWPEASPAPAVSDVGGLAGTSLATPACIGLDGLNPCTRANARIQTGWITDSELGIMWTSAQNGAARPYPYTRVAILDPATLAVVSQPDIYSTTSAWLYPAVAVDERGHLGGVVDNLGGNVLPTMRALIRDDLSPDAATGGWETYAVATSTNGTAGRWGDYNGAVPHAKYPRTWLAAGHVQAGGSGNGSSQTHSFWFGRQRDAAFGRDSYTVAPCRLLDTRATGAGGPLLSAVPRLLQAAGACGVPADAVAITLDIAAVAPPALGFITLYPGNGAAPNASSLNFVAGDTRSNNATIQLSADALGTLAARASVANGGGVDVVIDVTGYYK
jgi:hypothetical protein